jgi:hypothetical protein
MRSFTPEEELTWHRSQERLPETEEALYDVLVPETKNNAIQLEEFADLYGKEAIEKDKEYVKKREAIFEKGPSVKFGELFEAIVDSQIEESDLMGPNASVIVPSRYDDVANGIDGIVEFQQEQATSHLALGIDVTKSKEKLSKKFDDIRNSIKTGNLSRVRYFRSKTGNFRGELRNVPRVVIGADHPAVEDVSSLMLRLIRMKKTIAENRRLNANDAIAQNLPKEFAKVRQELALHPIQGIVLTEIKDQLLAFKEYAMKIKQYEVADSYSQVLSLINVIIAEKEEAWQDITERIYDDEIFQAIKEEVAKI